MNILLRIIARLKQSAEERWPPEFYDFWDDEEEDEELCGAPHPTYLDCTEPVGHKGRHLTVMNWGLASWPRERHE